MKRFTRLGHSLVVVSLISSNAFAWEPETTQAGLAEQAAISSRLHKKLVSLGFNGGLFEPLTVPPADAPQLMEALKLLSPSHGSVPDARGRQTALAWIAAGAALADVPAANGANHFFDPTTGKGWAKPDRDAMAKLGDKIRETIGRESIPATGIPAPDWVVTKENPFNLDGFLAQYSKAIMAPTPGERSRHMAGALVAAGAILHALGDVGAPSRARGDSLAHLEPLGGGPDDLGSRTERIAALVYGRLGVPAPNTTITRDRVRDYFTNKAGTGLADITAKAYFSPNTLPGESRINEEKPQLVKPYPVLPARLNLMAASRGEGTTLRDAKGTCLARYKVDHGVLAWSLDDECILDQLTQILPTVAAYETGLLDFLTRGELAVAVDGGGGVTVTGADLGPGQLDVLSEDERGVRKKVFSAQVTGGSGAIGKTQLDAAAAQSTKIICVFRGADKNNEPIVATGVASLVSSDDSKE